MPYTLIEAYALKLQKLNKLVTWQAWNVINVNNAVRARIVCTRAWHFAILTAVVRSYKIKIPGGESWGIIRNFCAHNYQEKVTYFSQRSAARRVYHVKPINSMWRSTWWTADATTSNLKEVSNPHNGVWRAGSNHSRQPSRTEAPVCHGQANNEKHKRAVDTPQTWTSQDSTMI